MGMARAARTVIHEVGVRKVKSPVRTVELLEFLAGRGQGR